MKRQTLILRGGPYNGYRTHRVTRLKARLRRAGLRAQRLCITSANHGPATHGVLCAACRETHRKSA